MHKKKLSIIIVNWNTRYVLESCILSVIKTCGSIDYEICIVDNASSDGSSDMVKTKFPQTIFVQNNDNMGFSKGCNIGLKNISDSAYVLFLNPDTLLMDDSIPKMIEFMDQS